MCSLVIVLKQMTPAVEGWVVGSPSTLQDKRSAIDVLIIRESVKKTGCVIRWAPTGLQLADGHAREAHDESKQAISKREEPDNGTALVDGRCVHFSGDTSVDLNTVQVKYAGYCID